MLAMRDGDTFRPARAAGSVEDVAKRVVGQGGVVFARRRIVERADVVARRVDLDRREGAFEEAIGEAGLRDHARRGGVGERIGDPIRRVVGVQRNVGRTHLEQPEQGGISFEAAVEQNADAIPGLDSLRGK